MGNTQVVASRGEFAGVFEAYARAERHEVHEKGYCRGAAEGRPIYRTEEGACFRVNGNEFFNQLFHLLPFASILKTVVMTDESSAEEETSFSLACSIRHLAMRSSARV